MTLTYLILWQIRINLIFVRASANHDNNAANDNTENLLPYRATNPGNHSVDVIAKPAYGGNQNQQQRECMRLAGEHWKPAEIARELGWPADKVHRMVCREKKKLEKI